MKKNVIFLSIFTLLTLSAYGSSDGISKDPKAIEKGWRKKTIKVENGGENPTVTQLLRAFHAVWPTTAAGHILEMVGDRDFFVDGWYDGSSPVFVDPQDYCTAWYNHGDTSDQNLEARTYERENGHMLFAVRIEQNNPEYRLFCCFYDYNPEKQTLTPEDEPYKNMHRKSPNSALNYYLGERYDQTLIVEETPKDDAAWFHHYAWDGMKHTYHHTGRESYESEGDAEAIDDQEIEVAPEEMWNEEAVAARVREYFDAVNKTFAEGSEMEPYDLDENYYTTYWNEILMAVLVKEGNQNDVEDMFFIDDNHWTAGMETPLVVRDVKVELTTGSMAEALVTLEEKNSGDRRQFTLLMEYDRQMWRIQNWLEKGRDHSESILVQMEEYIRD